VRRTAALIVGGGPAGSAAAIMLARGGVEPLLIERCPEPRDVVCGGFLGWDALAGLRRLGIYPDDLGAKSIHRLRLVAGARRIEIALPYPAAGFSRRMLDEALLERAGAEGAAIERGISAKRAEGLAVYVDDSNQIEAGALFLATGKHELRGVARPKDPAPHPVVGLKVRLPSSCALSAGLDGIIELHLFRQGYAGLLLQEDGSANLCLSVAASRLAEAGGKPEQLIATLAREAPLLADRFERAGDRWLAIAGLPYGWRASATPPGLFRIGDQAAVIASLAGDGVAIALRSGRMAAEHYLRGGPSGAQAYQATLSRQAARPLIVAGALRTLGESAAAQPLLGLFGRMPGIPALLARLTRIGI
jgi:flavin-dependent dehydrogenase